MCCLCSIYFNFFLIPLHLKKASASLLALREMGVVAFLRFTLFTTLGMIRLGVSEAIRFLDRTGEPTVGKTRPETILRQLTTKKGQVYSMLQGKRDVDTVLAMGIMEDVGIIPQPAGDTSKVDLIMNVVERKSGGGISAGGGISSGITNGPLAGLIGRHFQ
ncbi:PREDICTED: outer envelope protein 80, chloroplastic-like [Nicotiana attenuata]|uniref:outer envelope protein 80, chloroplastic-like n=1 Tax=Nicotiana attenuata TaxID=49451 RepID=UPI000904B933|nr:PREDICTED: outer envelope protein 80, chloroplastic-like [Nicotiana attenuata]